MFWVCTPVHSNGVGDITIDNACYSQTSQLELHVDADSVMWEFGDPQSDGNFAEGLLVEHAFSKAGTFPVTVTYLFEDSLYTQTFSAIINNLPVIEGIDKVTVCKGEEVYVSIFPEANTLYRWSNNHKGSNIFLSEKGTYWVEAERNGCVSRAEVLVVTKECQQSEEITVDYCGTDSVLLWAPFADKYEWTNEAASQGILVDIGEDIPELNIYKNSATLIENNELNNGTVGVTNSLEFNADSLVEGTFMMVSDAITVSPLYNTVRFDNSNKSSEGQFLLVFPDVNKETVLWEQSVSIKASHNYSFSFWMRSIDVKSKNETFKVIINGEEVSDFNVPKNKKWTLYEVEWSSGIETEATIQIMSEFSNEMILGLDDINLRYTIKKNYKYSLHENCPQCETFEVENASVKRGEEAVLTANSNTVDCNDIHWYDEYMDESHIAKSCSFTTPNLSASQEYWVNAGSGDVANFATGFTFDRTGEYIPQYLKAKDIVTVFTVNENMVLNSLDIQIANCVNEKTPITLILKNNTTGKISYYTKYISCTNDGIIRLAPHFQLHASDTYILKIAENGVNRYMTYNTVFDSYSTFFHPAIDVLNAGNVLLKGAGPFFNWNISVQCPKTKIVAAVNQAEICGNGVDDDGDGDVDEVCKPFNCSDNIIQASNKSLLQLNKKNNKFSAYLNTEYFLNAAGFNPSDNTIYAMAKDGEHDNKMVRIDASKSVEILGYIMKPDNTILSSVAAAFSKDGACYMVDQYSNILYKVNLETLTASEFVMFPEAVNDIDINPLDGKIYGIGTNKHLLEIDPNNRTLKDKGELTLSETVIGEVESMHFSPSGDIMAYGAFYGNKVQNDLVVIDVETLEIDPLIVNGQNASFSDGCSCPYRLSFEKTVSADTVASEQVFYYTITIANQTGQTFNGVDLFDTLDYRVTITDIIHNDFGDISTNTGVGGNILHISDMTIAPGVHTLAYSVQLNKGWYCPNKTIETQALLKNIDINESMILKSDYPMTTQKNDPTASVLVPNWDFNVGKLSHKTVSKCDVVDVNVLLKQYVAEEIKWYQRTDTMDWEIFDGEILAKDKIDLYLENDTKVKERTYIRAEVSCRCDTQYVAMYADVIPIPDITLDDSTFVCVGDSIDAGDGYISYKWNTGSTGQKSPVTSSGYYSVTITDEVCKNSDTTYVVVNSLPAFSFKQSVPLCDGDTLEIGTDRKEDYSYLWDNGESSALIDVTKPGNYYLSVTNDNTLCVSHDSITIVVNERPVKPIVLTNTLLCYNDELPVIDAVGEHILWFDDIGTKNIVAQGEQFNYPEYDDGRLGEGEEELFFLQSQNDFCKSYLTKLRVVRSEAVADLEIVYDNVPICIGQEEIAFEAPDAINDIVWSFENAIVSTGSPENEKTVYVSFPDKGDAVVSVTTKDDQGCEYKGLKEVVVHPLPMAKVFVTTKEEIVTIENASVNTTKTEYLWEHPESDGFVPIHYTDTTMQLPYGAYTARLKAVSQYGCVNVGAQNFSVHAPFEIFIPNAFAPGHGAEKVSMFYVSAIYLETFSLTIFDNWGNTLWKTELVDENGSPMEGWDGKLNGELLPAGCYTWMIEATFQNGDEWEGISKAEDMAKRKIGSLMLIR